MARFDDSFLQGMKDDFDIVGLIESYGTKLKERPGTDGELIGLCPIHDDKSPSLVVNRKKNVWNCLGACGCGGDVIQWVMHAEKVSFRYAVELLKEKSVGKLAAGGTKANNVRRLESPIGATAADHELLGQIADYYHARLKESPDALSYLQKRLITDPEAIERFKLGFSDRTLGLRLPIKQVKDGADIRERLQTLGVLKESGHELLRGCITFPIPVIGGIGEIYGRRIDNGGKTKVKHFYLNGPHVGVWNIEAFVACDELILCESIIDALTFWCAGFRNVTTIYGANGLTSDILDALKQHNIKRLLIAYDSDEAGNKATEKHSPEFERLGIELFRIKMAAGMDINSYAQTAQGGCDDNVHNWLALLIRNATWLGKGKASAITTPTPDFLQQSRDQFAVDDAKEKTAKAERPLREKKDSQPAASASDIGESKSKSKTATKKTSPLETVGPTTSGLATGKGPAVSSLAAEKPAGAAKPQAAQPPAAEKQPLAASPSPAAPKEIDAEIKENGIVLEIGNRSYRVRGLEKNLAFDVLKLNVMVRKDEQFYVDTFDLYAARARGVFVKEASRELGFDPEVIKRDLGKVLLKLESLQDEQIEQTLAAKEEKIELTDKDKQAALDLLKQPNLIERILADFAACGVVGEETNKLVGYLAATSRKLDKPLAVVIQSSSAAGKSLLMDAILSFIPSEEQVGYSAMTGQSLFYMGSMELQHKILAIAEEEGVAQASYALKLLQSEGQLTIASTGKDASTGRMETQEYHVEGPVMIFLTTTAIDIDEELLNRCVVLTVDENRDQTRAIHDQQRKNETLEGLLTSGGSASVRKLHQNVQRLLRPLQVVNPYAHLLKFCDDQARRRRDHMKYLTLIRSITLLHQYQREIKTVVLGDETVQYIEVELTDIVLANRLADQVLGKSIDELPPQTRRLLMELFQWVQSECKRLKIEQREFRFTRRMIRESLGWSQTALKKHLERLMEMEYVLTHRSGSRRCEYELIYDGRGREGQPTMCGLIDVAKLTGAAGVPSITTDEKLVSSSPPNGSSSPLPVSSSPQDHPKNTPLSSEVVKENHVKNNGKPR